jgi:hypothetical protein
MYICTYGVHMQLSSGIFMHWINLIHLSNVIWHSQIPLDLTLSQD